MPAALTLLLLLVPLGREPVGQGDWQRRTSPVSRRVASLLAGAPARHGFVSVVPLYARIPSEARFSGPGAPAWPGSTTGAREVREKHATYLRIGNPFDRPVLVPAGAVFARPGLELYVGHDALVAGDFAALLPVLFGSQGEPQGACVYTGVLPPLATGLVLHGQSRFRAAILGQWRRHLQGAFFGDVAGYSPVVRLWQGLRAATRPLPASLDRTAVGAVFLIAGQPAGAHVFATNELFEQALPDLLLGVAIQARMFQYALGGNAEDAWNRLSKAAAAAQERARAIAHLRGMLDQAGEWNESYGEGYEVVVRNERDRVVGHAVLNHRRVLIHAGFYALGSYWPGAKAGAPPLGPPGPPETGTSEAPPGQIDRKARPSLAESRQRPRRPGPTPGNGNR